MAEDIIRSGAVKTQDCIVFGEQLAYFFYGRPAYRTSEPGVVKAEALCPFCFIFEPNLIDDAKATHAFDTGAFNRRMYSNIIGEEMEINDFQLEGLPEINQLISSVFGSREAYINGDTHVGADKSRDVLPYQFHAKAYLDLILSPGRNEPDDRIFTIEVIFGCDVLLRGRLRAIALPHTLCSVYPRAPWLETLPDTVSILPYEFVPGRPPEHYHTLLEQVVKDFYNDNDYINCT